MRKFLVSLSALPLALGAPLVEAQEQPDIEIERRIDGDGITIVTRGAPLSEVLEMLARRERLNIMLATDADHAVSVNLFRVSASQAVKVIAEAAGLVAERRLGGFVILDRDEAGKDSTDGNTVLRSFHVKYSDPETVSEIVEKHLSRYGVVSVLPERELIVVQDLPPFVDRIGTMIDELDVSPQQIVLEARILDISLRDDYVFGVDWSKTLGGDATIGAADLALPGSAGLFFNFANSNLEVALSALSDEGRVRTLSTPMLRALENQPAEVVIGNRLGFRVTTTINEVTTESVEFLESGVILRFTASVDRSGGIVLEIHPEVSTGTIDSGLPNQQTTEVTTTLVTQSGQTVFIGGLLRSSDTDARIGVPLISKIPLVGRLFSRTESVTRNFETVVLLKASLIDDEAGLLAPHEVLGSALEGASDHARDRMEDNFGEVGPGSPAENF